MKGAISREKLQREIEWQRLHPGMDALLSHRRTNYVESNEASDDEVENEVACNDISVDEDGFTVPQKRPSNASKRGTTAGRSRGRGRGRGTSAAAAASSLLMSTEPAKSIQPPASSTSKWPPRR